MVRDVLASGQNGRCTPPIQPNQNCCGTEMCLSPGLRDGAKEPMCAAPLVACPRLWKSETSSPVVCEGFTLEDHGDDAAFLSDDKDRVPGIIRRGGAGGQSQNRLSTRGKDKDDVEQKRGALVDAAAMKEKVRQNLLKPKYDVQNFYWTTGIWQHIARHPGFEKITLFVIGANALWIAVDTDYNKVDFLLHAKVLFQLAENLFCSFFTFEWIVRFASFQRKRDGIKDAWFVFDGLMATLMVLETWAFPLGVFLAEGGTPGSSLGKNAGFVRVVRLLRLSRICRMARLLRCMPELMIMVKGLLAAARSVFFTLVLLAVLVFIFAIFFTQMTVGTELKAMYFRDVRQSMYFLLVHGTLLLSTDYRALELGKVEGGFFLLTVFFMFILLGAVLLMNMLIGVLCEVVTAVAITETEEILVNSVRSSLEKVMAIIDEDGGGTISRDEFMLILENLEAMEALQEVGVDVVGLVDFADFIFGDEGVTEDEQPEIELTLSDFMEVILQLRGSNGATVKDIVDLRKFCQNSFTQRNDHLQTTNQMLDKTTSRLRALHEEMKRARGWDDNTSTCGDFL
eukprot:TRINITY_DN13597_c0_g2_i1.p1 TRINITY_DN13597_c0_g2~~TRINITY_DN13597_c0_g2_i1.p1  ORF type:complete len:568 (-),score=113.32 TRINITY_DN13597_c0_g2_i1:82-1785(-)